MGERHTVARTTSSRKAEEILSSLARGKHSPANVSISHAPIWLAGSICRRGIGLSNRRADLIETAHCSLLAARWAWPIVGAVRLGRAGQWTKKASWTNRTSWSKWANWTNWARMMVWPSSSSGQWPMGRRAEGRPFESIAVQYSSVQCSEQADWRNWCQRLGVVLSSQFSALSAH